MAKAPAKASAETKAKKTEGEPKKETKSVSTAPKKAKTKTVKAKAPKKSETTAEGLTAKAVTKSCKIASCKRRYRAKGYCVSHYKKWRQGEYGMARYKTCSDFTCNKPMALNRHGFCEDHYQSYFVKGMEQAKAPAAAPAPKVEKTEKAAAAG